MDQMNLSMTDHPASYVRKKVKSGRYNNASEVVRRRPSSKLRDNDVA